VGTESHGSPKSKTAGLPGGGLFSFKKVATEKRIFCNGDEEMRKLTIGLTLILSLFFVQVAAANLVINAGFESAGFTPGWTVIPAGDGDGFINVVSGNAHSGDWSAAFGAQGSDFDTITQNLATVVGQSYTFDFWLKRGPVDPIFTDLTNEFKAFWNGTIVLDMIDFGSGFDWVNFSYTFIGTGADNISFAGLDHPSFYYLDDVNVSGPGVAAPLPGAAVLLSSGLLCLLGYGRMRKG
jgi:hypothetical protein